MGDLGGYGIAELPPAGPLFARGPYRALGQKGNPWEVVRNSISAHVTHAEITHFYFKNSIIIPWENDACNIESNYPQHYLYNKN